MEKEMRNHGAAWRGLAWAALLVCTTIAQPALGGAAEIPPEVRAGYEKLYPPHKAELDHPKTVSARKGPVEITLDVANTRVHPMEITFNAPDTGVPETIKKYSLWLKVTLKNVGKAPIESWTEAFSDVRDLEDDVELHYELKNERGEDVVRKRGDGPISPACGDYPSDPEFDTRRPPRSLKPGESIASLARTYYTATEMSCLRRSRASLLPPYAEVHDLDFYRNMDDERPQKARIRLVYARAFDAKFSKRKAKPEEVDVATPWIPLEIFP